MALSSREGSSLARLSMLAVMASICCTCPQAWAFTLVEFDDVVIFSPKKTTPTVQLADSDDDDDDESDSGGNYELTDVIGQIDITDNPINPGENRPGTMRLALSRSLALFAPRELGLIESYDQPISRGRMEVDLLGGTDYLDVDFNSLHSLEIDATNGTAVLYSDTILGDTIDISSPGGRFNQSTRRALLVYFENVVANGDPLNSFTGNVSSVRLMSQSVPEPMSLAMWSVVAVGGLAVALRKRRQAAGG